MFFTLEIQEIRRSDRLYRLPVRHFTTIREIKQQLKASFLPFPLDRMALFHSSRSEALPNQTTLHEIGIDREGFALSLSLTLSSSPQFLLEPLKTCPLDAPTRDLLTSVRLGLKAGHPPGKTDLLDSTGGVYFLKGATGSSAAVFKPHDEEQGMPNNPKGHAGNGKEGVGLRPFFKPGEGYLREAAAYLLDSRHFAGVPPTTVAHCQHPAFHYPNATSSSSSTKGGLYPKLGSLQQFVKAADTFEDISSSLIGTLELQKIALFDMRVLNNDRNSANLLAIRKDIDQVSFASNRPRRDSRSGSMTSNGEDEYDEIDMSDFVDRPWKKSSSRNDDCYELIPIDHGYCLPTKLLIEEFDWVWFYCPQISQPVAPEIKKYMNELNIDELIDTLRRQIGISEDALFLLRVTHNLILQGINQGLTLRDIAALIARTEDGVPSPLEKAVKSAEENAQRAVEAHGGFFSLPSPPRNARGKSPNSVNNIVNTVLPSLATRDQRPPSHNLPSSSNDNDVSLLTPLSQKVVNQQSLPVFNGSYLRPRGPLTFLQSFEPSALSPQSQKDISFSNDSFFLRNFSPEYDTTESSSDSSAELLTSIAMNNKAPMMDSSGHDDQSTEHFESSLDREDEGKELLGVDLDEPFDLPRNAGPSFRRVSSFSNLEVQTTEPMVFEKTISKSQSGSSSTGRPPNKDRHSCCTSEEEMELENGSTSVSPSSEIISELPKINIPAPGYGLTRVVSFNAFESAPLYEPDRSDRHFNRLKRERRKLSAKSPEFQELRMNFANEAILKTLASHFKTK